MTPLWLAAGTLAWREIVHFYRDRSRVIGALAPPIVFWFLIGSGLGGSFRGPGVPEGTNYLQYFFPGTILLIVLFTAVFSTISVIEDRREGFLQGVLVAPVPRSAIVIGKVFGGSALAFLQGLTFLLLAPAVGLPMRLSQAPFLLAELWLAACGLTGLGFWLAWRLDTTQGFHAVMNLLLIPMWLLSGALFPVSGAPTWLRWVMAANPVTYASAALQHGLFNDAGAHLPGAGACLAATFAFAAATFLACAWEVGRSSRR